MKFTDLQFSSPLGDSDGFGIGWMRAKAKFPNGYTASVIYGQGTYGYQSGLFEMAVLHNDEMCYTTPITNDTLGHLTPQQVEDVLNKIEQLPKKT